MGVDSRLITLLFVLIAMPGYVRAHGIDFDADLSFSNGTQLWGREEDEEFEPPSASEFPLWKSSGAGKMPVNVDSFGAVGDGIADDTQAFVSAWERACSLNNAVFLIPEQRIYKVNATKFRGPCQGKLIIQIAGTIVAPEEPRNWDPKNPRVWLVFSNLEGARIQGGGVIDGSGSKWWAASFFFFLFLLVVYIIDSHAEEHQRYSISKLQITADNLVLPMPYSLVIKRIWQISSSKPPGRSPSKICTPCNRPPKLSKLFMAKRTSSRVLHPRRSH